MEQGGDGHFIYFLLNQSANIRNLQLAFVSASIRSVVYWITQFHKKLYESKDTR